MTRPMFVRTGCALTVAAMAVTAAWNGAAETPAVIYADITRWMTELSVKGGRG